VFWSDHAQIAFAVDEKEAKLAPEFVHKRRFGKTEYNLYVHSYLNYGLNSARQLMLKGDANTDGVCLPPEYSGNWQDLTLVAKEVCFGMGWAACNQLKSFLCFYDWL
jgi:hypothetical protein